MFWRPLLGGASALVLGATACIAVEQWEIFGKRIEAVGDAELRVFGLRDEGGRGMDCLEVFQPAGGGYKGVYGVHHTMDGGVFAVHLAHSDNLRTWVHVKELDAHASQPTIWETHGGGYLLAYEKDAPGSCWIRVRFYESLDRLRAGVFVKEFDVPRSLAPTAEGTPSFEMVKLGAGDDLSKSEIRLRFHYFEKVRVDQLALGILTDFKSWKAESAREINAALKKVGGHGNLGDRTRFGWRGERYYLQEVQGERGKWGSWGVFLCDERGMPLRKIEFKTPRGATAFSNPAVTAFKDARGHRKMVVTVFLHSEGNHRTEVGELLFVLDSSAAVGKR